VLTIRSIACIILWLLLPSLWHKMAFYLPTCSTETTLSLNLHASTCAKCHGSSRLWHAQVRSRSIASSSWRTALAQRSNERVQYKLAVTVHRCLQDQAPKYLVDHCIPVSDVASRQHLSRCFLTVPRFRWNTFGRRAFAVGGPMA